jgi:DNA-binding GntR family transcriptional regulator
MPNTNQTFQQQAYDFIRGRIINLGYKPGEYIMDTDIASQLKISRTPVREAFHRLEKEGLLINEARRGWKVYSLSLEDIHEIFDIKEVIEGMIARKAASCRDEHLRGKLRNAVLTMQAATDTGDTDAWLKADFFLHDILFQMAGNERAIQIIENLNAQWHRVRIGFVTLQGRTKHSAAEHQLFVESILEGNADEAELRMRSHLNRVREELVHLLVSMILPFVNEGV